MDEHTTKDAEIIGLIQALRQKSTFPWPMLVALVSVIALGVTVQQSWTNTAQTWAIMGKRIDDLEASRQRADLKLESVPELKWNLDMVKQRLDGIEKGLKENTTTLGEVRDTIQSIGLRKTPK